LQAIASPCPSCSASKPAQAPGKRENWHSEAIGVFHQPQGFAVAAGSRHAEVAGDIVFSVASFLMADDDCGTPVYAGNSTDEGRIVSATPIAVKLDPLVANCLNVIEGAGAARVTRELQSLHGGQAAENFLSQLG
jgi:hypothetical protein